MRAPRLKPGYAHNHTHLQSSVAAGARVGWQARPAHACYRTQLAHGTRRARLPRVGRLRGIAGASNSAFSEALSIVFLVAERSLGDPSGPALALPGEHDCCEAETRAEAAIGSFSFGDHSVPQ